MWSPGLAAAWVDQGMHVWKAPNGSVQIGGFREYARALARLTKAALCRLWFYFAYRSVCAGCESRF